MKEIFVQAQADHIASLFKATPVSAIEELVWNALDADAKEVKIDVITNALGAVEAIRVSDDGTGINIAESERTFGSLGGSWKRQAAQSASKSHRRLHGRNGRGRFKAFALGSRAEWRTTARNGDGALESWIISADADRPGVFGIESVETPGPATGTEVYIANASVNCDSLLDARETVQTLSAKFALYLKSYTDVRVYFNGLPVTPVIVQKSQSNYTLHTESGAEAKLEVIEWKCKFAGAGRLVFAGKDGFELHEVPSNVRSGGEPFTAYLVSPRFSILAGENALLMDELNPEVRQYLDEARKILKAHFAVNRESEADLKTFKKEWTARIASMSPREKDALLKILKKAIKADQNPESSASGI